MDTEELNEDAPDNEQIKENLIQSKNEEPDEEDEEEEEKEEEGDEEVQIENRIKNNIISNEIQIEVKNNEVIIDKNGKNDNIDDNSDDEDSNNDDNDNGKDNNNVNLTNQNPNNNVPNENNINNYNNEQIKEFYNRTNRHKKDVKVNAPFIMVILIIIHYTPSFICFGELIINIGNNGEVGLEILESFFYIILWIALIFKIIFHKGSKRRFFPCCNVLSAISAIGLIIIGIASIVLFSDGRNSKTRFLFQIKVMLYIFIIAFDIIFFIIIIILIACSKKVNLSFIKIR